MKRVFTSMNSSREYPLILSALFVAACAFFVAPAKMRAANIVVNTLSDNVTNGDGLCTLREAIQAANTNNNLNDCIGVGSYGTDLITFAVAGTITLSPGPGFEITDPAGLTIQGPASLAVTISAARM